MSLALCILFAGIAVLQAATSHGSYKRSDIKNGRVALIGAMVWSFTSAIWLCNWISHE